MPVEQRTELSKALSGAYSRLLNVQRGANEAQETPNAIAWITSLFSLSLNGGVSRHYKVGCVHFPYKVVVGVSVVPPANVQAL